MAQVFSSSPLPLGAAMLQHPSLFEAGRKRRLPFSDGDEGDCSMTEGASGLSSCGSSSSAHQQQHQQHQGGALKRHRTSGAFSHGSFAGAFGSPQQQQQQDPQDRPLYSARALETEIARVRAEAMQALEAKERQMREAMGALARDLERFQGENRILKRAVNIQNTRCKDVEAQLGAAQEAAAAAAAYAKRVEQVNYALGVRVQQMEGMGGGGGGGFMERQPPDVY